MNIIARLKQIVQKFAFIGRIRLTQTAVIKWGMICIITFLIALLAWDASLFMQSISPLQPETAASSKRASLSAEDIDDAIHILNTKQQQLNLLLTGSAATSTISF